MNDTTKGKNAKKGYWELSGLSPYIGIRTCSVCKAEYDIDKRFNECPNCGTKMLREFEKEDKQ